jgi:hypothetical protein
MDLILTKQDLGELDIMIKRTPFEYAYPIWLFLRDKLNQQAVAEAAKIEAKKIAVSSLEEASKMQKVADKPIKRQYDKRSD